MPGDDEAGKWCEGTNGNTAACGYLPSLGHKSDGKCTQISNNKIKIATTRQTRKGKGVPR